MECGAVDELFACLYQGLQDSFDAEFTSLRIFAAPCLVLGCGAGGVRGRGGGRSGSSSTHLLASERPVCGEPGGDQAACLFGSQGEEVKSSALIPLGSSPRHRRAGDRKPASDPLLERHGHAGSCARSGLSSPGPWSLISPGELKAMPSLQSGSVEPAGLRNLVAMFERHLRFERRLSEAHRVRLHRRFDAIRRVSR